MTHRDRVNKAVLLVLVLSVSLLFLYMIRQYLMALFMAALFSALLTPAYRKLCLRIGGREVMASIIMIVAVFVLFLVPLSILIGIVAGQAVSVSQSVTPWIQEFINQPSELNQYLEKIPFYEYLVPYRAMIIEKLGQAVGNVSTFLINSLSSVTKMTLNALIGIVIMFYSMFFLLISGEALLNKILYFLPLRDEDEQLLLHRFTTVTVATLKGTLIIGIIQGSICGAAFALAGIQGAVFWGTVMAVLSFIPAFGTALAWGPALIILLLQGEYWGALILLAICGGVAGNIDNLLRPRLVGKDTQMHDLFVLFSTLGGISMFGILGIIVGPIIAALFITLWELYGKAFRAYLPKVGPLRSPVETEAADISTDTATCMLDKEEGVEEQVVEQAECGQKQDQEQQ
ncbi:MAG: AI-2E family transporter [Desulfobulbaceae bacterium]|nr:AI-2E family transporter [Desulfobulbaceae bacterium]